MKLGLSLAAAALVLDQLSKWAVVEHLFKPEIGVESLSLIEWYQSHLRLPFVQIEALPFFNFAMVWNEGIGLGMFGAAGPWVLIAVSLIIVGILGVWMHRNPSRYLHVALGLMIGGAIGNVIDRVRYHAVVDFLDFHIGDWHYPTFNVADSFIVIGVALLLLQSFFEGKVRT
mgnify:CR=1 FL=1